MEKVRIQDDLYHNVNQETIDQLVIPDDMPSIGGFNTLHTEVEKLMIDEFNQLVKPSVYRHMHKITSKLIHLHMQDLQKGKPFVEVISDFLSWCGKNYIFCTWGPLDLFELQRNNREKRFMLDGEEVALDSGYCPLSWMVLVNSTYLFA